MGDSSVSRQDGDTRTERGQRRRRRRRRSTKAPERTPAASGRRKIRLLYFGLAALWGYAIGGATLLAALRTAGYDFGLEPILLTLSVPGAVVAVVGGMISAVAYRETRRGSR